ncbi:MAG: RHS repeat protein [Erythrobacter sp.]|nr:RHS repeat protein [Erythrobacter sp.]
MTLLDELTSRGTKISRKALALGLMSAALFAPGASYAQVSGTEVNEEAVDEFGLERKTGRFSWSSGEVIGIGSGDSRVAFSITGIRNPARATQIWPAQFTRFILNEPRLLSEPMPDPNSPIPYAITPNAFNHTVESPSSAETFRCLTTCYSEYLTGGRFEALTDGFLYTDQHGVEVRFEQYSTKVSYPDGREIIYGAGQFRKNNFGYLLKHSGTTIQAVNQAIDFCDETSASSCAGLSKNRSASLTSPGAGIEHITDAAGQTTAVRWEAKTAKLHMRPQGASPQLQIPDVTENYPLGITLPGSVTEDITVSYHPHDPELDTHDDILVSAITRLGVSATYEYDRMYPQGLPEAEPSAAEAIDALTSDGGLLQTYQLDCLNGNDFACEDVEALQAIIQTIQEIALQQSLATAPEDPVGTINGFNDIEMTITSQIEGEATTTSFAVKPTGGFANTRRRLVSVTDELGRTTAYRYNQFEEVAGVTTPEGNSVVEGRDGRGNLISRIVYPKSETSNLGPLTTVWTYLADCDGVPLARCNKPLTMTDPNGNVTEYTYNDRGQLIREVGPAPTAGAARPTVVNAYTERTAYIKGPGGVTVAAGPPISLLTESFTCIASAVCDAGTDPNDKVVTEYDYGPTSGLNNLLLRGMSVTALNKETNQLQTLTTCYTYNYFGERIAETQPKAGLTSCP